MNLNISYSVDFVKERTEKTRAVQAVIATGGGWVWPKKTLAQWDADLALLDGAVTGTPAQVAEEANAVFRDLRGRLDERTGTIHRQTLQAVGVMRARALDDAGLRPGVDELSARGDSVRAIEDEGEELLAVWKQEFGTSFSPAPGLTYAGFEALFIGASGSPAVPGLRDLKTDYKEARAASRSATGKYNAVINRLWDECVAWYAEAGAVFPEGTDNGDLIRSEVPTIYNPPTGGGGSSSSSSSSSSSGPLPLPGAPQNVVLTTGDADSGAVVISLDPAPPAEEVTGYHVYRDGVFRAATGGPTVLDGFTPGESVTLTMRALNATGEGPDSAEASGTAG